MTGSPFRNELAAALWATVKRDRLAQLTLAAAVVLAFLYLAPVLPAERRSTLAEADWPTFVFLSLGVFALLSGLPRIAGDRERRFWRGLALAFGAWWLSSAVLIFFQDSASPVAYYLAQEVLNGAYYAALVLALEGQPDRRKKPRPTSPFLAWSATAGLIFGLFGYFVLIPVWLNWRAYEAALPSAYLFLVLDLYVAARLAYLARTAASRRWRSLYGLLALTAALTFVGDVRYSLFDALDLSASRGLAAPFLWYLQFVSLVLAARLRHHPFGGDEGPASRRAATPVKPQEQTLAFALLLPLVHFTFYAAGVLDPSIRSPREALMFVWLLVMGGVALIQNRLLERGRRHLEEGTATLNAELAWRARMAAERQESLSQLRAKETEIEARNAELERLTYTVSHDLKGPLVTIRGFLGLLVAETARGELERAPKHIAVIDRAAARMARLLDELTELLKVGRVVAEPREVALDELARAAAARLVDPMDGRGVTVAIAPDLPAVVGDRERLLEVFHNLLDNALRYTGSEEPPRVEIGWRTVPGAGDAGTPTRRTADRDTADRIFFVRDHGAGIEPRDQRRVFELFTRLDPQIEGTGVGLALAKRIVESHGGRIWVESQGRGHGSTFCFTLGG